MRTRSNTKPGRTPLRAALLAGATMLALVAGSGAASAALIKSTNVTATSDFTIDWSNNFTTNTISSNTVTASATAQFSNFNFMVPNQVTFQIIATNTSTGMLSGQKVRLTAFGWDTAPPTVANSATNTSSVYSSTAPATLSGTTVSVCLYSGNNCGGGGSGGLYDSVNATPSSTPPHPANATFDVTLNFSRAVPPLTFSNFYGKFQTFVTSYEDPGYVKTSNAVGVGVPEPGSLALLGTGLIGLGLVMRRRRRRS